MLLGTFGDILLGNLLAGKGAIATSQGCCTIRAGKGAIATGQGWCAIKASKGTVRAGKGTIRADQDF